MKTSKNCKCFFIRMPLESACLRHCGSQCGRQKQNFAVRWRSKFFSIFDHFYSPFNPVFYCELKNIKIFEIGPKLTFLDDVFTGTIFWEEGM